MKGELHGAEKITNGENLIKDNQKVEDCKTARSEKS